MIYPWQEDQWQQLQNAKQHKRLVHALLLSGTAGIGKSHFAHEFSMSLLCQASHSFACHQCHDCRLVEGRVHPNVLWIQPEKTGVAIKVDQVRDGNEFIQQSSLQGEYRILIISPANKMNLNAANALLKTLEEPARGSLIILCADQTGAIPATILSRCQRLSFPVPPFNQALDWLKNMLKDDKHNAELLLRIAHGAPLLALTLVEQEIILYRQQTFKALQTLSNNQSNLIKFAEELQELTPLQFIDFVLSFLVDVMHLQLQSKVIVNQDFHDSLSDISQRYALTFTRPFLNYLQRLRSQLSVGIHLNKQLMMEDVFVRWATQSLPSNDGFSYDIG